MWRWLFLVSLAVVRCQQQPPITNVDPAAVADGVDSFRKLYGIATQIMELSGNIMGSQGGDGQGSRALGGDVRPRFQGVRNFETDNSVTSYGGSNEGGLQNMARLLSQYGSGFLAPTTPPTTTTTTTQRPNPFQSLINTFIGSSVDSAPVDSLPPPPTPRPRQTNIMGLFGNGFGAPEPVATPAPAVPKQDNSFMGLIGNFMPTTPAPTTPRQPSFMNMFGVPTANAESSPTSMGKINLWEMMGMAPRTTTTTQAPLRALLNPENYAGGNNAQNIDAMINALMRSNARPAEPEPTGPGALLSQLFGGK